MIYLMKAYGKKGNDFKRIIKKLGNFNSISQFFSIISIMEISLKILLKNNDVEGPSPDML